MIADKNQQLQASVTARPAHSLVPLAQALRDWLHGVRVVEARVCAVADAKGRVLAAPLVAPHALPATPIAMRQGYAVDSAGSIGASSYAPVPLLASPALVAIGEALPPGTDAVLGEDAVSRAGPYAELLAEAAPGEGARRAGEDAGAGEILRNVGQVLRDVDLMIARRAGIDTCAIREPRIGVVGEGELAMYLSSSLARCGAVAADEEADAVIVLGAIPDNVAVVAPALALRPGEDIALALDQQGRRVMIVPPLPESAVAASLAILPPLCAALSGHRISDQPERVALTRRVSSRVGVAEIVLLQRSGADAAPVALGDLPLSSLAQADLWAMIAPEAEGHAAGDAIDAFRIC